MQGIVEIYGIKENGERDLLAAEENLTTVGFAEVIVDMLTTPSAVENPAANNAILDSSNYTIQAFSLSKDKEQFSKNLHDYRTSNLLYWTRLDSSDTIADATSESWGGAVTSSVGWYLQSTSANINATIGAVPGTSGLRITSTSGAGKGGLRYQLYLSSTDGNYGRAAGSLSYPAFNGTANEIWFSSTNFTFSIDVKYDPENPPDLGLNGLRYSEIRCSVQGDSTSDVSGIALAWDSSGVPTIVSYPGASPQTKGGIKPLGGGWYRAFIAFHTAEETSVNSVFITVCPNIFDAGLEDTITVDNARGSIFVARPQLELGSVPTNYVENDASAGVLNDIHRFSLLNETEPFFKRYGSVQWTYYIVSGSGDLSFSALYGGVDGDKGVSAYIPPKTGVTPAPHPNDRQLTPGAITPVEEAFGINFNKGHNTAGTYLGEYLYRNIDSSWTFSTGFNPYLGRHAAYFGTYITPAAAAFYLVSGYDDVGLTTPLTTGVPVLAQAGFAGQNKSSVDLYGHIQMSHNGQPNPTGTTAFAQVQIDSDFSSTGEVTYYLEAASGTYNRDNIMLNCFGGVNSIGLWGLDLKQIKKASPNANPPYSYQNDLINTTVPSPTRRYKLMAKKVLNDNIFRREGKGSVAGISNKYINIIIYWKVKFI